MGQKVNPILFRMQARPNWTSKWFAKKQKYKDFVAADIKLRDFLMKNLGELPISKINIERTQQYQKVTVWSGKPGAVVRKKGEEAERLRKELKSLTGISTELLIEETTTPELDANLIAKGIAEQLKRRVSLKRALKKPVGNALSLGALGIKIMGSGRLNGAEIARSEWFKDGRIPLQTIDANIDYANTTAKTTYGIIGIKVWVHKLPIHHQQLSHYAPASKEEV